MNRVLFLLLMLILLSPLSATAQEQRAVVKEFSGKVEVKAPGGDWRPVTVNMPVVLGATVSTGFGSRLVLAIGETQVSVQPLTRMVIQQLIKTGNTNTTRLTLRVGKVNAVVKAASGEKNDFSVKGPASTAAVRGTEFSYDANVDDRIDDHLDSVYVTSGTTGHTLTMFPGRELEHERNRLRFCPTHDHSAPERPPGLGDRGPGRHWLVHEQRTHSGSASFVHVAVRHDNGQGELRCVKVKWLRFFCSSQA